MWDEGYEGIWSLFMRYSEAFGVGLVCVIFCVRLVLVAAAACVRVRGRCGRCGRHRLGRRTGSGRNKRSRLTAAENSRTMTQYIFRLANLGVRTPSFSRCLSVCLPYFCSFFFAFVDSASDLLGN